MLRHRLLLLSGALTALFLASPAHAGRASRKAQPEVLFTVSMPKPHTHLLDVELRVRRQASEAADAVDLVMPVWTPGAYVVREFARNVQEFRASNAQGQELAWRKLDKNTWRVETRGAREWLAAYRVYINDQTETMPSTAGMTDRRAFWNNAAVLMYPKGTLKAPAALRIAPPSGWKIATGLPPVSGEVDTFRAQDFDQLYDCPVLVGTFKTVSFKVQDIPHRIIMDGDGNYDLERLRDDIQKIVEAGAALMGGLPYQEYSFLFLTRSGDQWHGLEHANSTAIAFPRFVFRPEQSYKPALGLIAHEFFHLWNVKRIRPDTLGPFDYTRENYTRLLWVAEGLTSYYQKVLLRRAGLISDKELLTLAAQEMDDLSYTPARRLMSVEEASLEAWIKHYRRDENDINSQVDYYTKGAVLGLLLDLEIRKRSGGIRSLDDVMRVLYNDYALKGRNYTSADFQRACETAAGSSLEEFFNRFVRGREEVDYDAGLAAAGLRLDTTGGADPEKPAMEQSYVGMMLEQRGDRLMITKVYEGTPAYNQGLNAGDQIVALDGVRVSYDTWFSRMDERRPGETIRVTIFRDDELRTLEIKVGGRVNASYRIVPLKEPSAEQAQLYRGWLGGELAALSKGD
jgi:predicted metalloprotease with PDZ domain